MEDALSSIAYTVLQLRDLTRLGLGGSPPKDVAAPSNWNGRLIGLLCTAVLDIMLL